MPPSVNKLLASPRPSSESAWLAESPTLPLYENVLKMDISAPSVDPDDEEIARVRGGRKRDRELSASSLRDARSAIEAARARREETVDMDLEERREDTEVDLELLEKKEKDMDVEVLSQGLLSEEEGRKILLAAESQEIQKKVSSKSLHQKARPHPSNKRPKTSGGEQNLATLLGCDEKWYEDAIQRIDQLACRSEEEKTAAGVEGTAVNAASVVLGELCAKHDIDRGTVVMFDWLISSARALPRVDQQLEYIRSYISKIKILNVMHTPAFANKKKAEDINSPLARGDSSTKNAIHARLARMAERGDFALEDAVSYVIDGLPHAVQDDKGKYKDATRKSEKRQVSKMCIMYY
jgi:hypothetical protein